MVSFSGLIDSKSPIKFLFSMRSPDMFFLSLNCIWIGTSHWKASSLSSWMIGEILQLGEKNNLHYLVLLNVQF